MIIMFVIMLLEKTNFPPPIVCPQTQAIALLSALADQSLACTPCDNTGHISSHL